MPPTASRAISLPFRVDGAGRIAFAQDNSKQVADRLRSIIGTVPGERVMRPGYGTPVRQQLFDVNDPLNHAEISATVREAVKGWEPAVTVLGVDVHDADLGSGILEITLRYELAATGEVSTAIVSIGGDVAETTRGGG